MSLRKQDVDRLLAPEFASALVDAPVAELRLRRDECQRAEVVVSYLRRVLQGELDLVLAAHELRATGGGGDLGRLVHDLPAILAPSSGQVAGQAPGAHGSVPFAVPAIADSWLHNRELVLEDLIAEALTSELLEDALPGGTLPGANVGTYSDEELVEVAERLRQGESDLSRLRRALHERIDELQAAVVQRYKTGAADVDSLLR